MLDGSCLSPSVPALLRFAGLVCNSLSRARPAKPFLPNSAARCHTALSYATPAIPRPTVRACDLARLHYLAGTDRAPTLLAEANQNSTRLR